MATFYLVIVPQGVTPTWSRANIATNSGWTATTIAYHDADTDPGTGSTYQFVPDASGLPSGTQLVPWAVWYDGTTTVGPVQGAGFTTASAGATYNDTLSESATLAEAVTLLDTASNGSLYNEVLAASVALSDALTSTAALTGAVTESAALSDALTALATFQAALTETVTTGDTVVTQADQTTLPRVALGARLSASVLAARVQATSLSARLQ